MIRDDIDDMNENPLPELETEPTKRSAKKGKKSKPAKKAPAKKATKKAAKAPAKAPAKAKKAAAPKTAKAASGDRSHGRGALRDVDGMLTRMGPRLAREHERLTNTAKRAERHGDTKGAKRVSKLAEKLLKLLAEFS